MRGEDPMRSNVELVRRAYRAFNDRDIEGGAALMDPAVEWPDAADGTFIRGADRVQEHWRDQFRKVDPTIEVGDVREIDDGRVEARVRQVVRSRDGAELSDDRLIHVFTISGHRIKRMDVERADANRTGG